MAEIKAVSVGANIFKKIKNALCLITKCSRTRRNAAMPVQCITKRTFTCNVNFNAKEQAIDCVCARVPFV